MRSTSPSSPRQPASPRRPVLLFNDPPTTYIYTLSLHDALPISQYPSFLFTSGKIASQYRNISSFVTFARLSRCPPQSGNSRDRKSTRLNSSHSQISYAVFCLKKNNMHTHVAHDSYFSLILTNRV